MNLTPIPIRGRRKRPPPEESSQTPKLRRTGPKGGRPRLTPQALLHSSQHSQSQRRRRAEQGSQQHGKTRKRPHYRSRLESLPVELLERVFLYALNLQLPRASPALGAALSREGVYRVLILRAFWDDHDDDDGEGVQPGTGAWKTISRMFRPMDAAPALSYEERRALQVDVLRCRWCTVPRVMAQIPALTSLVVLRRWVGLGVRMDKAQEEELERAMAGMSEQTVFEGVIPDAASTSTTPNGEDTAEADPGRKYTLTITPKISIRIDCADSASQTEYPILGVTAFPDHLLRGSSTSPTNNRGETFSKPHTHFLELLRLASGYTHSDPTPAPTSINNNNKSITLSRDALQEGIHAAILNQNYPALLTLLKLDEYHHRTTQAPEPYLLPPSHFHTAANLPHPADPTATTLQLLLRASAESLPADDPAITQWAMHQGGALGRWVLDLMTAMPQLVEATRADPALNAVFYMGRANEGVELARRYVREVVGVEAGAGALGSWMGEVGVEL